MGKKAKPPTSLIKAIMNSKNIDGALTIWQVQENLGSCFGVLISLLHGRDQAGVFPANAL